MIRKYTEKDIEAVLTIWATSSIEAHAFIGADFWQSQVESMRNIYIPASETYVFEKDASIIGFLFSL